MHHIRYFLALSETLNLTKAAERCNVSQPALSRAIKVLETELGGELLRRERTVSHLTELGRRMLPMLRQCYETGGLGDDLHSDATRVSSRRLDRATDEFPAFIKRQHVPSSRRRQYLTAAKGRQCANSCE
jgi:DNA-binding transcriptional LysR family regulator